MTQPGVQPDDGGRSPRLWEETLPRQLLPDVIVYPTRATSKMRGL